MPAFKGKTLPGESFSNETLKGRPVLIQFWATWCGYCRRDQPAVERIVKESPEIVVLAVSVNESRQKVRKYLEGAPRTAKIVVNEDTNLPALFPVNSFPTYVLVDAKGGIVDMQEGSGGYEALRELLKKL
jgi:thiol-disulfide isomerase/thioredoxin